MTKQNNSTRKQIALAAPLLCVVFSLHSIHAGQTDTEVSIEIGNTFSGSISLSTTTNTSSMYFDSGVRYTNSHDVPVLTTADTGAVAHYTRDVVTGQTTGTTSPFALVQTVETNAGDGLKEIGGYFLKGFEWLAMQSIHVYIDTIAPNATSLTAPANNTTLSSSTTGFDFNWQATSDSGAGLSGYQLVLASDPSFTVPYLIYQTTNTSVSLPNGFVPNGTSYRYVQAVDYVGNVSQSNINYFHKGSPTVGNNGGGGGGGGSGGGNGGPQIDDCVIDNSPSLYDGTCDAPTTTTTTTTTTNTNTTITNNSGTTTTSVTTSETTVPTTTSSVITPPTQSTTTSPIIIQEVINIIQKKKPVTIVVKETSIKSFTETVALDDGDIQITVYDNIRSNIRGDYYFSCDPRFHNCDSEYKGGPIDNRLDQLYQRLEHNQSDNVLEFYTRRLQEYQRAFSGTIREKRITKKELKNLTK